MIILQIFNFVTIHKIMSAIHQLHLKLHDF